MSSVHSQIYARPYAEAAFHYAKSNSDVDHWDTFLKNFAAFFSSSEINHYVTSPLVEQTQLINIVADLLELISSQPESAALYGKSAINQNQVNFLLQLAFNKRLAELPAIAESFQKLRDEDEGVLRATVSSAFTLDPTTLSTIEQKLTAKFHKKIIMQTQTDAQLIGGLKIQLDDYVLDTSIAHALSQLRQNLAGNDVTQ
jgi:F-type H+-transporting ATPase subunit delta